VNGLPPLTCDPFVVGCIGSYFLPSESKEVLLPILKSLRTRFERHNFKHVAFYTDKCCHDAALLSEAFPHLATFRIQNKVLSLSDFGFDAKRGANVVVIAQLAQVRQALYAVETHLDANGRRCAFDCKWTYSSGSPGQIATMQFAFPECIFLFNLSQLGVFPSGLRELLKDQHMVVVGLNCGAIVAKLLAIGVAASFSIVDLVAVAMERSWVTRRQSSLSSICAVVFGKSLPKDSRTAKWDGNLSPDQIELACLDAAACCELDRWSQLMSSPEGRLVAVHPDAKQTDMQGVYFLKCFNEEGNAVVVNSAEEETWALPPGLLRLAPAQHVELMDSNGTNVLGSGTIQDFCPTNSTHCRVRVEVCLVPFCPPSEHSAVASGQTIAWPLDSRRLRPVQTHAIKASQTLTALSEKEEATDSWAKIRIKLDAFHAMQRISRTLPKQHAAYGTFLGCLREAMFSLDAVEMSAVREFLTSNPTSCAANVYSGVTPVEAAIHMSSRKLHSRLKRVIPPPAVLRANLENLRAVFEGIIDSKTKQPLFSSRSKAAFSDLLVHVDKGCLSDLPGAELYYEVACGLATKKLKCARGTSGLEGCVFYATPFLLSVQVSRLLVLV
jgi:hypothetical protein